MGWLQLVGSIKLQVSFAKEPYKRDYILQKRPIILSILLTVSTPYLCCDEILCNTLQHTVTPCNTLLYGVDVEDKCHLTRTHCNTLQHTATHCNTLQHTATHCNTLQHTATHCNTLQHTPVLSGCGMHLPVDYNALQYTWNEYGLHLPAEALALYSHTLSLTPYICSPSFSPYICILSHPTLVSRGPCLVFSHPIPHTLHLFPIFPILHLYTLTPYICQFRPLPAILTSNVGCERHHVSHTLHLFPIFLPLHSYVLTPYVCQLRTFALYSHTLSLTPCLSHPNFVPYLSQPTFVRSYTLQLSAEASALYSHIISLTPYICSLSFSPYIRIFPHPTIVRRGPCLIFSHPISHTLHLFPIFLSLHLYTLTPYKCQQRPVPYILTPYLSHPSSVPHLFHPTFVYSHTLQLSAETLGVYFHTLNLSVETLGVHSHTIYLFHIIHTLRFCFLTPYIF